MHQGSPQGPHGPQGPYGYGTPPPQQQGYYPPQPTVIVNQNNNGCLKAILVLVGIFVLGNVAMCATCATMADSSGSRRQAVDAAALDGGG